MTVSPTSAPYRYSQEQVQQILNLAIAHQAYEGEFTREQLLEIAEELGITDQAIAKAESLWLVNQQDAAERLAFDIYRQSKFKRRLVRFGLTSTGLVLINCLTGPGGFWSLYIIAFLALPIGFHAWNVYQKRGDGYERAFRHWVRRQQFHRFVDRWWSRLFRA
jgi:hypothetical protein